MHIILVLCKILLRYNLNVFNLNRKRYRAVGNVLMKTNYWEFGGRTGLNKTHFIFYLQKSALYGLLSAAKHAEGNLIYIALSA